MPSSTSSSWRLLVLASAAIVSASCSLYVDGRPSVDVRSPSGLPAPPAPVVPQPGLTSLSEPPTIDGLAASFDEMTASLPSGEVGVALFNGQQASSFGTWTSGAAWSTIKVPLSIAALRVDQESADALMQRAISQSDNAAADRMWNMIGDPQTAANAVGAILREGGDTGVAVQSQQVRPPYSPYGQTDWPADQAALFGFRLPCIAGADSVIAQMRALGGNQQWGLASFADVAAKGGWGPGPDGGYLVRQIALVTNHSGTFGVSISAKPADGSFDTGTAMLDSLGAWVDQRRDKIPGGHC